MHCPQFILSLLSYLSGSSNGPRKLAPSDGTQVSSNKSVNDNRGSVMMKAVATAVETAERAAGQAPVQPLYLEALTLVEPVHRGLRDVIKDEFDRRGRADISSVQALLLYNIGDKELTAGELRTRGYYLGSNVSYNLKKLVELGFLDHQRSRVDRRSVRIRLTAQGQEIRRIVDALYQKHVKTVEQVGGISNEEFATLNKSLHRLERFWTDQILYRL